MVTFAFEETFILKLTFIGVTVLDSCIFLAITRYSWCTVFICLKINPFDVPKLYNITILNTLNAVMTLKVHLILIYFNHENE